MKGISFFCADIFLSHRVQKFRRGTRQSFRKLRLSKKFMDKRRRACITIFCQSLCLIVPRNFVWQPFSVSEKIGFRKNLGTIRGFHYFLLIIFCPTVPKNFVGKLFDVSESFWFRSFLIREVRVYHDIFSKSLSHITENFYGEPFCVSEKTGYRKILCIRTAYH